MEFTLLYWLQGLHAPWLDQVMAALTFLGNAGFSSGELPVKALGGTAAALLD